MPFYTPYIKRYLNMSFTTFWRDLRSKRDPDEMRPSSSQLYEGKQGQGKTISMNFHIMKKVHQDFPKALIVANQPFTHMEPVRISNLSEWNEIKKTIDPKTQYVFFEDYQELIFALRHIRRGKFGVIFMIDEIHQYFHSHDSKAIPMWVVRVFSQQRKQYILIVATAQKFEEVSKVLRDRLDNVITCNRLGYLIIHHAFDPAEVEREFGNEKRKTKASGWCWITESLRDMYDTRHVIDSGREVINGSDLNVRVSQVTEQPRRRGFMRRR